MKSAFESIFSFLSWQYCRSSAKALQSIFNVFKNEPEKLTEMSSMQMKTFSPSRFSLPVSDVLFSRRAASHFQYMIYFSNNLFSCYWISFEIVILEGSWLVEGTSLTWWTCAEKNITSFHVLHQGLKIYRNYSTAQSIPIIGSRLPECGV